MNNQRLGIFTGFALSVLFVGCQLDSACDDTETVEYGLCVPIPVDDATGGEPGDGDGGVGGIGGEPGVGDGDEPVEDANFGASCTEGGDECTGGTICAAPKLPICTQIYCGVGEVNDGVCPDSMKCNPTGQADPPTICF